MSELYIGLMSGTSLDGIDAALVEFSEPRIQLIDFHYQPFSARLRRQIHQLSQPDTPILLSHLGKMDAELGQLFANTTLALLNKAKTSASKITAIGSHGQTVYHAPDGNHGFSLQIGDPNRIAEITGITTICDFRRRDIAKGGQGAPLVPAFHQAVFAGLEKNTTVLNIGGIANISVFENDRVRGFDTGPGNTLMDYWCQLHLGKAYDANGDWASRGNIDLKLLNNLLDDDYFELPPPKSTGKEYFSPAWLTQKVSTFPDCKPEDIQATLCQLTTKSISDAILKYATNSQHILVCGGGIHNRQVMAGLTQQLSIPHRINSLMRHSSRPCRSHGFCLASQTNPA